MPFPTTHSVCRFIRESEWSEDIGMAKARSLKSKNMSVWHEGTLTTQGATLDNLKFDSLEGSGQFILTVQDYLDIANEVSSRINKPFQIQVEWRPEDEFVPEP